MKTTETVGMVGLGNMGYPIALNLIEAGYRIVGYEIDVNRWKSTDQLSYVEDLESLANKTTVILLSLPDSSAVEEVVGELLTFNVPHKLVVVDTSTIGAKASQAIGRSVRNTGLEYLDSPVSGGVRGAVAGSLAVMCAGPKDLYNSVLPILTTFTANQFLIGPLPGQAQTVKVVNNFLSATALAASCEALHFGQSQGLDLETMCEVINVSTGMNTATLDKIPNQVIPNHFNAGFSNSLLLKDISLYLDGCHETGICDEISQTVVKLWDKFVDTCPDEDATAIFNYIGNTNRSVPNV
jgi:3-hydroxyisobutyrate dehydrogenase-like beta-hydroxyacid dehydrogenase